MSKAPKDPQEIFPDIVNGLRDLFADDLVSVILYGSAASGDYVPGKSDINFMIVVTDEGIGRIDQAFDLVAGFEFFPLEEGYRFFIAGECHLAGVGQRMRWISVSDREW